MTLEKPDEAPLWYAMSAPYREMKIVAHLKTNRDIKVFLPWNASSVWWGSTYASESFPIAP